MLIVAYLVFGGGGGATYHLIFAEADQLVRGDQVQVGGVPVGSVTNIELTHDFKADVTIHVDSSLTPLHEGTIAQVRVPSLSSVANRYIALTPGPNNKPALPAGATLPASATKRSHRPRPAVQHAQPEDAQGPAGVHPGHGRTVRRRGQAARRIDRILRAVPVATDHFFSELVRDQPTFTNFLVETAKAVTTIGARKEQLTDLIENAEHDLPGDRRRADAARARASKSCR